MELGPIISGGSALAPTLLECAILTDSTDTYSTKFCRFDIPICLFHRCLHHSINHSFQHRYRGHFIATVQLVGPKYQLFRKFWNEWRMITPTVGGLNFFYILPIKLVLKSYYTIFSTKLCMESIREWILDFRASVPGPILFHYSRQVDALL